MKVEKVARKCNFQKTYFISSKYPRSYCHLADTQFTFKKALEGSFYFLSPILK